MKVLPWCLPSINTPGHGYFPPFLFSNRMVYLMCLSPTIAYSTSWRNDLTAKLRATLVAIVGVWPVEGAAIGAGVDDGLLVVHLAALAFAAG
jgi:hypothetical protein